MRRRIPQCSLFDRCEFSISELFIRSTSRTEKLLGFALLQCFTDFVLLLLDGELVVALQLDFTDSTEG
jgi:hypothetical protein